MRVRSALQGAAGVLGVVALLSGAGAASAQSSAGGEAFDPVAVVDGIVIDRTTCADLERRETAVWVEVDGHGACLRYYAAGLVPAPGPNPIVAAWLNGDVLGPKGKNADKRQKGFGPAAMIEQERRLSWRFGVPFVFLGRPGTYGSAGKHHTMRGRPLEARLVDAQLDALKARYGIRSWSLGGHSGGGTLVAELLARRSDIRCAAISSGASAYRAYLEARGLIERGETLTRFDPFTSLDQVPTDAARRIFVIGDPRESNVPFSAQTHYFDGLRARGHAAWLVPLERATDPRHHDLVDFGEVATGLCAAGASTDEIVRTLDAMPDQRPRQTN